MTMSHMAFLWLAAASTAAAQPAIAYRGIVNAASYAPVDLPSGGIARGSIFSIFGSNLGPAALTTVSAFPLQPAFAGVSIKVRQGSTSVAAIPLAVSAGQINAIMPSNAPLGRVSVQVTYNGASSNFSPAIVSASSFGAFAINSGGFGPGVVQNFVAQDNQPINSLAVAAAPGDVVTLYGTGLGAVADDTHAPAVMNAAAPVDVFTGGLASKLLYAGRSSCCAGLDQIVFQLPANTPLGCWVPVQVRTNGMTMSNSVTIAVSADRSACTEPNNPLAAAYISGGNVAVATVIRHAVQNDVDYDTAIGYTIDSAFVTVGRETGGPFAFNRAVSLPPLGSCTSYLQTGGLLSSASLGFFGAVLPSGGTLDAGALNVQSSTAQATLQPIPLLPYGATLANTLAAGSPVFLTPGQQISMSAQGGTDVGEFQVNVQAAAPLAWTNQASVGAVDRRADLPVTWTPQAGTAAIIATNYDIPTHASATVLCTADAAAGAFTVPSYVLETLPASRAVPFQSDGWIMLGFSPAPVSFSAAGLSAGFARALAWSDTKVLFQ